MGDRRLAILNLISVKLLLGPFFFFPPLRWSLLSWKMLSPTRSPKLKTELSTGMEAAIQYCPRCFYWGHRKQDKFQAPACTGWLYCFISNTVWEKEVASKNTLNFIPCFSGLSALQKSPPRSAASFRRCLRKNLDKPQLLTLDLICMVLSCTCSHEDAGILSLLHVQYLFHIVSLCFTTHGGYDKCGCTDNKMTVCCR